MNHVSDSVLGRLRWLLIAFSGLFIVGYGIQLTLLHAGIEGRGAFNPIVAGMALGHLVFELVAQFVLLKRSVWRTASISFLITVLIATMAIEYSGVYVSPFAISVAALTIISGAYGQYLPFSIWFIFLIGFMLSLGHVFNTPDGGPVAGLLFMIGTGISAVISYFLWHKHYVQGTNRQVEDLNKSLQKSQLQANIVIQAIADGVIIIDETQVIRLFNPAAALITGWKREEAEGLDWRSVFNFVDDKGQPVDESMTPIREAFDQATSIHDNKLSITAKSGNAFAADFSVSPLLDETKHVTGLVGIFRDISEDRREESQRADFISTASHEMRTPVAAIEGYLSLALNDKVATIDARAHNYLEKAHSSTQHLGQLFQDLLTSAKAEDGRLTSHPKVVEIGSFLEQLSSDLKFSAEKKGLFVEFTVGSSRGIDATASASKVVPPLYYAHIDPDRMREVVTNLFDNAVKYTDEGKITLGLTGNEQVVQLYVRDTGPGIPAEDAPHLFQKFYRVDNSATRTIGGTGLGLFICRKIVELYHGRIWVESELGKGSTFFINLPRLTSQKATQLQKAEAASNELPAIDTPAATSST